MDTPIIAQYYREKDPAKRRELLYKFMEAYLIQFFLKALSCTPGTK